MNKQVQQSSNSMLKASHDQNARLSKISPTKTVSPLSCFKKPTLPVTIRSRSMVSLWLELSIMINRVWRHWSRMTFTKFTDASKTDSKIQWLTVTISDEFTITNIYKPPSAVFLPHPIYNHPVIYSGDSNSCHKLWGYTNNDPDSAALHEWTSNNDLNLLYNPKQSKTFHSAIWNTFTNPDLTFYSADANNLTPHPTHKIGKDFTRSQHCPTIITNPTLVEYTPSTLIPRWNFNKADWEKLTHEC